MAIVTREEMMEKAPAIFATAPATKVTDRYTFVSTIKVIEGLEAKGWFPVRVKETKSKNLEKKETGFHSVAFRTAEYVNATKDEYISELMLATDHAGLHRYKGYIAIQRVICGNGLVAVDQEFDGFKIKHQTISMTEIEELTYAYVQSFPNVMEKIDQYKKINLNHDQRISFAKQALGIKNHNSLTPAIFDSSMLLKTRRQDDEGDNLWNIFNVIQENIIKGGIRIDATEEKRRTKSRGITNIQKDIEINRMLWTLMASYVSK